jgi:hypothetical protein
MAEPMTRLARRRLADMRQAANRARSRTLGPVGFVVEGMRALRTRAAIAAFQQRPAITRRFAEPRPSAALPSVVAVVTHVAALERAKEVSIGRLAQTLDSLLASLGHTQLELVVNTMRDRHFVSELPAHLHDRVIVREREVAEPLLLGFEAQEEFVRRAEAADWFLYLEDDVLLEDALVLEKLSYFNSGAPPNALLLPHRYEFWRGRRTYIDLVSKTSADICSWNRLTVLEVGGWRFAEFENPHSGFYALSRAQLRRWLDSGRHWYGRISFVAARESAATGCLAESFRLYKPHPDNMSFLEVRHLDTKYSEEHHRRHKAAAREAT